MATGCHFGHCFYLWFVSVFFSLKPLHLIWNIQAGNNLCEWLPLYYFNPLHTPVCVLLCFSCPFSSGCKCLSQVITKQGSNFFMSKSIHLQSREDERCSWSSVSQTSTHIAHLCIHGSVRKYFLSHECSEITGNAVHKSPSSFSYRGLHGEATPDSASATVVMGCGKAILAVHCTPRLCQSVLYMSRIVW